jgi:hypothetical protein
MVAINSQRKPAQLSEVRQESSQSPTFDEATAFLLQSLRQIISARQRGSEDGCDIQVASVASEWADSRHLLDVESRSNLSRRINAMFLDAAWELCRRGLLRPGALLSGLKGISDDTGYSLTTHGEAWLTFAADGDWITLQPDTLSNVFGKYRTRLGEGYYQRSQEAIRCRNADAWLAACAMVGAAAESILLAAAIAKTRDEGRVMRAYISSRSPKRLPDIVVGQAPAHLARAFRSGMGLISYWRDVDVHAQMSAVSALETEQAIHRLLMLAQFCHENWDELTCYSPSRSERGSPAQSKYS